jgi:hypothetical protein
MLRLDRLKAPAEVEQGAVSSDYVAALISDLCTRSSKALLEAGLVCIITIPLPPHHT